MPGWDENHDAYNRVYNGEKNESSFGHELIAGGASFAAFKAFEDHQRKEGKPVSHQFAKELLAGFAGAEVDKLAETKGEDFFDREKAKHQAKQNAEHMYDQHYGQHNEYNPQQMGPPPRIEHQFGGYNQGHHQGHNQGYNQGPGEGYNQGYNQGPGQGYHQGPNQGPNQGYNQGYDRY
ncbi:hypothetical protein AAFC00_003289 [Neodothiora populina]|uniref:CipC-like antibiotic response protein n=1 Tax=Neodothiora populina TaxID=2781224 RepID=A0ABR3P9Y2_9PEZI